MSDPLLDAEREAERQVERALAAGEPVAAMAWYSSGVELPPALGARLLAALDAGGLADLSALLRWSLDFDAYLASGDDAAIEPREVPDEVDQRAHATMADHWLGIVAATSEDSNALNQALHCLALAGRDDERPRVVEQILALDRAASSDDAIGSAIAALVEHGDYVRASEVAQRRGTADAWLSLALALEEVDPAAAVRAYDHALRIDPEHELTLDSLIEHLRTVGDTARADELAARLDALENDDRPPR